MIFALRLSLGIVVLTACEKPPAATLTPTVPMLTALGRQLFFDSTLSVSGRMSCATCHNPQFGWGPANALPVQPGGPDNIAPGVRAVLSLGYAQDTHPFDEHFREDEGENRDDQGPAGGRMWDGRARSAYEQAALPLLSSFEMANPNRAAVLARLRASSLASAFREAFGARVLDDSLAAWEGLLSALESFQQSPDEFFPYTSKYDAFLRGQAVLSRRERRGLDLFNDPAKGNCAACHPSALRGGVFPQFTDRGLIALGVPRNPRIAANADLGFFDLGLCGPLRTDLADRTEYCGLFKTPTLRNVARRQVFFHNGVFDTLEQVLRFYAQRDVRPRQFYSSDKSGRVRKYDDLPSAFWGNVNVEPPFDRRPGQRPAFSDAEARDIIAFLRTLNDGYAKPTRAGAR